jgi:FixJ family two-component response regulator
VDPRPVVYVVDDEQQVRDALRVSIELMGLDVECFATGQQFLDKVDASRVACLVTDLHIPDLTGQKILEALAARQVAIPAIMISGNGDIPAAVRAMGTGAINFLEKPYCLQSLRESIQKAIDAARRRREDAGREMAIRKRLESLSSEERAVLEMTAAGKPDKAIASQLDLSIRTIQLRRVSMMKKLHVRSRVDLIRLAPLHSDAQ